MDEKRNVQTWTSTYPALETFLLSARSTLSQLWHVDTKAATTFSFCPFDFKLFPILIFDFMHKTIRNISVFFLPKAATAAMDKHPFFKGCNACN